MISIFEAQTYLETITEGGRNKPWLVTVDTGDELDTYVAKFFSPNDITQSNVLYRELCGVALAKEFELNVLNSGIIQCTSDFRDTLDDDRREVLNNRHSRHGFGTKYLEGAPTFSTSADLDKLPLYEVESIYAFDVLIKNVDRRLEKPNILLKEETYYLIDHELSLHIPPSKSPQQLLSNFPFERHICHAYLSRKMSHARRKPDFATFFELLRDARFNSVIELAEEMNRLSYEIHDYHVIKQYLDYIRRNKDDFINILLESIS